MLFLAKSFEDMRLALVESREQEKTYQHDLERRVEERAGELLLYRDYLLRSNRNLAALNAVSSILSHSLELTETLNITLDRVIIAMDADAGGIYLNDEHSDELVLAAYRGFSDVAASLVGRLPCGDLSGGQRNPSSSSEGDVKMSLCREILEANLPFGSLFYVPLEAMGETLGSIFLANSEQTVFNSEDEALFASIGWQVAMAVRNARLYETVQWKEKEHA